MQINKPTYTSFTQERQNKSRMGFELTYKNTAPRFDQIDGDFPTNNKKVYCSTSQKSSEWNNCLDLSSISTKAEELDVKVDKKNRTLTVSGRSETQSTRDGMTIFSTHVWTKDILIPEDVELETIAWKLHDDKLTFVAERVQKDEQLESLACNFTVRIQVSN